LRDPNFDVPLLFAVALLLLLLLEVIGVGVVVVAVTDDGDRVVPLETGDEFRNISCVNPGEPREELSSLLPSFSSSFSSSSLSSSSSSSSSSISLFTFKF